MGVPKADSLYGRVAGTYSNLSNWRSTPAAYKAVSDEEAIEMSSLDDNKLPDHPSITSSPPDAPEVHSCFQIALGWFCMVLAVIAGASVGPVFKYTMAQGVRPLLAASWRGQTMVIALLPFALYESRHHSIQWHSSPSHPLPFPLPVHILIAGLGWSANLLFWIVGLQFVSTFKASVISSSHPVLLVLAMHFSGHTSISLAEWIGVAVAFVGMFVSNLHTASTTNQQEVPMKWQLLGFFLCFLAAAGEVVTIFNRLKTRKYVPLLQYTLITSAIVACMATVTSLLLEGSQVSGYGQDCLLGWTTEKWRVKMLLFGLWVGAVCITGFNYAMTYIPPLVFSSVTLVDPAVTALISYTFGIESLPGLFSLLGGAVVIGGVALISYGERSRSHAHEPKSSHHNSILALDLDDTDGEDSGLEEDDEGEEDPGKSKGKGKSKGDSLRMMSASAAAAAAVSQV